MYFKEFDDRRSLSATSDEHAKALNSSSGNKAALEFQQDGRLDPKYFMHSSNC